MPYGMDSPKYVYRPRSEERVRQMVLSERRRLGIPDECVRIYGVDVPEQLNNPLRNWANYVRQKRGLDAAQEFVREAVLLRGEIAKPSPDRITKQDPQYVYRPREATLRRTFLRGIRHLRRGLRVAYKQYRKDRRTDWKLIEEMLSECATREEVAIFFGISEPYLRKKLRDRKREGLSSFGSGRKGFA